MQRFFEILSIIAVLGYFLGRIVHITFLEQNLPYLGILLVIGIVGKITTRKTNSSNENIKNSK
ncbi:hypothetical protein CN285_28060 [Bacillus cereus]|uniref:hypothetical protein n=1 Tax=Bacillus paramycoides TaxID=2026194 RepID=UPI000BF67DB6|nr:hypothetical protein [Bacillus paramycoides]PFD31474.1 hypothetical protein CN285_28060 [Bacillus cereus]PGM50244.1 hypothetical protein CN947_28480 [Bacillus cereus]